jgi:hypothetical protein
MIGLLTHFAGLGASCNLPGSGALSFPTWYKYLDGVVITSNDPQNAATVCAPSVSQLADVWLIVAAVIEMLLRIAALAAIALVIYGSVQYITSQADPSKLEKARHTIMNALVGLVIAIAATTIVSFVAGRFT